MTEKQLERAEFLKEEIRYTKARLDAVEKYHMNYNDFSMYGLKTDQEYLSDIPIYPKVNELRAMLLMMRERMEAYITELQKEFEEL